MACIRQYISLQYEHIGANFNLLYYFPAFYKKVRIIITKTIMGTHTMR